jgi:ABC-type lipoprotein export system ATPase subunit
MTAMPVPTGGLPIRCVGLRHVYQLDGAEVIALADVDLDVPAGSSVAVVGPSGSGKSTLLSLLAGLQSPTAGQLFVGPHDLATLSQTQLLRVRAEQVGVVVQNPSRNLLPFGDAVDNIRFAQRGARGYGRRDLPEPQALLAALGLERLTGVSVDRLSGGERQRVSVAVGMAGAPGVLLADEPTSQLDTANRDRVVELLARVCAEFGTTIVAITHDPDVAVGLGRRVDISEGRLSEGGAR